MYPSSRSLRSFWFWRGGTMRASELSRKLRNEARRSPRVAARFADLLGASAKNLAILELEPTLRVTLNPLRAWLHESPESNRSSPKHADRLADHFGGGGRTEPPGADVVLFVVDDEVRTFAATIPERALLHQLAEIGPATLDAWLAHDANLGHLGATRLELLTLLRTTTAAGLTAVT